MTTPILPSITDEQLAELEFQFQGVKKNGGAVLLSGDWLGGLIARLRAAEKDAARYRWLRDQAKDYAAQAPAIVMLTEYCQPAFDKPGSAHLSLLYGEHAEIAIDTAMEQCK